MYLSIGFAYELGGRGRISPDFVDTGEINDIYVDGSDVSWAVKLMGYGVNGMLAILYIFLLSVYLGLEVVTVLIPVLILRSVGLRKKYEICENEYRITKYIYFTAIGVCLILGLIILRFVGIIPLVFYTLVWALIILIYIRTLKGRVLAE